MLFARDKSQMCNNLLQFAHVYAWAREHGRSVMSMRFSYKYKYFKISRSRFVSFPLYLCAKWLAALRLLPTASFKYEDCDAAALEQKMLSHRHIVVSGWYARWYDLFLKYRDEICDLFTIDPQYTQRVAEWMTEQESAAETTEKPIRLGVHIRRGDYAEWHGGQFYYSDEVYADFISRFVSLMPGRRVEVYIAGNDPKLSLSALTPRCLSNPSAPSSYAAISSQSPSSITPQPITLGRQEEVPLPPSGGGGGRCHLLRGNAVEDLFMLSQCDYIIGPPSTYSLVAAMYRDIQLCRMDMVENHALTLQDFHPFDYWFRRIL